MKTESTNTQKRDGVLIIDGLAADFVIVRDHLTDPSMVRIRTATGESWQRKDALHGSPH